MTSNKIGVNLRVSGNSSQGGRRYMEDTHATRFIKQDGKDYEFAYFGIFDGHGGPEASRFARDNLLDEITKYDAFWSESDEDIMWAIRNGFLDTHQAMWREVDKWPKTWSGLPSTAGTTASVAIIKNSKLYIGHVGDSGIVLGVDKGPPNAVFMEAKCLTREHKPDSPEEKSRIEECGGAVVAKSGVQRVVWSRPKVYHKGPIRRSTQIDKIPFLAVARSLGDLWSYDYLSEKFVVSPEPDVCVHQLDPQRHKCLVLASDGLWNMLKPEESVAIVSDLEMQFEDRVINDPTVPLSYWVNPAERLVTKALNKWRARMMKADNTSAIVVLIDPLGPSKLSILKRKREVATRNRSEGSPTPSECHNNGSGETDRSSLGSCDAAEQPITPHRDRVTVPTTPKSAPPKLGSKTLFSGPSEEKPAANKNRDTISDKNVKKLTLPTLQSDILEDSVQLLSSLKNTPLASAATTVPPTSSAASKLPTLNSDGFTSIKGSSKSSHSDFPAHKFEPWPCSNSPDVRQADSTDIWPSTKNSGENVRTRSKSGPSTPAPGVLCQQKTQGNNKNKAPHNHDRFSGVLKPSRLSAVDRILRHQGENHMLRDKKGRTVKDKNTDFAVSKFEGVNKNNSNDISHSCSKHRNKQGLKRKTRRTLRRAKDVAKRAMCLENSLFLGGRGLRNPSSVKRKMEDCVSGPVAKRLRRSDAQSFPL